MNQKINLRLSLLFSLIGLAALSRLLPHPPNFTPVGAMGLFGAAYFSRRYLAFLVPFAAMWASDLLLNNLLYARLYPELYDGFTWTGNPWVYLSFGLIVILGMNLLRTVRPLRLLAASLSASVIFFLITNFGAWLGDLALYPATPAGLAACYAAGLPFFWNTLAGDLVYTGALFGIFEWASRRLPAAAYG